MNRRNFIKSIPALSLTFCAPSLIANKGSTLHLNSTYGMKKGDTFTIGGKDQVFTISEISSSTNCVFEALT